MLKIAYSGVYNYPVPEGHRFPMIKYDLIAEQLLYEGLITRDNLFEPAPVEEKWILGVHTPEYWYKLKNLSLTHLEQRRSGFELTAELIHRERCIMQGTIMAARYACRYGVAFNIAGGTHHAYPDKAEGFCLLNDNAIAAGFLLREKLAGRVLIIDLDVHQGNGTARIFQDINEVFTFSMHCAENVFSKKEQSDLDIELPAGTEDEQYLAILKQALRDIVDSFEPDFIFYQSGVDVLKSDKLGWLSLSREGCRERDRLVFELCSKRKIPVAVDLGGGYSSRLPDIVEAHCNTFRVAEKIYF